MKHQDTCLGITSCRTHMQQDQTRWRRYSASLITQSASQLRLVAAVEVTKAKYMNVDQHSEKEPLLFTNTAMSGGGKQSMGTPTM